jgi:hypothetical protein
MLWLISKATFRLVQSAKFFSFISKKFFHGLNRIDHEQNRFKRFRSAYFFEPIRQNAF